MALLPRLAALLALAGGAAAADYCDGSGGITHSHRHNSDPTCSTSCWRCSVEQVVAAMAAAPDDGDVQSAGCYALGRLTDSPANVAAIVAAGGGTAVDAALARFPGNYWVQNYCLSVHSELLRTCNQTQTGWSCTQRQWWSAAASVLIGMGATGVLIGVLVLRRADKAAQRLAADDLLTQLGVEGQDHVTELTRLSAAGQRFIKRLSVAGKPSARTLGRTEGLRQPEATPDMSEITVVLNGSDIASLAQRQDPEAAQPEAAAVIAEAVAAPIPAATGDWLRQLLSRSRLSDYEPAFREAQCVDEEDIRAMGRETLAGLGLNSVQSKRLQRMLEPVQPVVVVDAQAADAQAAVASAPAVGGFASPAAK